MKAALPVILLLVLVSGCDRPEPANAVVTLPVARVRVVQVKAETIPQLIDVTGTVRAVNRAVLASKVSGRISELPITLGQRVRADEVLLKIFAADLAARLTQARAQLSMTRRDLARERDLQAKGASTAETVRNLQDRLTESEAVVRDAEVQLGYTEVRAPFDGIVSRRIVNAGDFAAAGQPLLEIEGIGDFEVEARIPESLAAGLKLGAALECTASGTTFSGSLREISSGADADTRSVEVKIAVPAGITVRSGQFTRVHVPGPAVSVLLVPATAISVHGQMERVFVAANGNRASLRLVKTGATRGDHVEIISGLSASEQVIAAPPAGLRDGQPLEVQP